MKPIYFDCDGVLLDWEKSFRFWAQDRLQKEISDRPQSWDLAAWLGVQEHRAKVLIHQFNHSDHFANLAPLPGAVEFLNELRSPQTSYRFEVLSSCSRDPKVIRNRRWNLGNHFGDDTFKVIECLDLGESKELSLAVRRKGVWIEDNYHGALAGHRHGHKTFMIRCPQNQQWETESVPEITWVDHITDLLSNRHISHFM
jgi:beta-phosphoglucomutase-like phosphatase (HAD superfamily)